MSSKKIPISKSSKIKVGITIGDPSGIGPAITLKAIAKLKALADFVVIGDSWVMGKAHSSKLIAHSVKVIDLNNINHKSFRFGEIKAEYGKASVEYIDKALQLLRNNEVDCLVTCPISKEAVNLAGFRGFSGHTGYLAKKTGTADTVMMLLNNKLKISLVTEHLPLKDVSSKITPGLLLKNILITNLALKKLFSIKNPRIVVCGLNPHASDNGVIGQEENDCIKPLLDTLRPKIGFIDGPVSADVAIAKAFAGYYDCVIAMYHDQALIPLKMSENNSGVNMTLGLPFIRTSPLHGTAFDIARHLKKADPSSLIAAIKLAVKCASTQKKD